MSDRRYWVPMDCKVKDVTDAEVEEYHRTHERLYPNAPKRDPQELARFGMNNLEIWVAMYREGKSDAR